MNISEFDLAAIAPGSFPDPAQMTADELKKRDALAASRVPLASVA